MARFTRFARPLAVVLGALSLRCAAPESPAPVLVEEPILPEAGFVELPSRDVVVHGEPHTIEASARIFYNLRPAREGARDKPIFVLFNGFAAEVVRAFGTGPTTVVEGGEVVDNHAPLTEIANLVYIDPRQSGFSYDVRKGGATQADCGPLVFNEYTDAADVLLAALDVLDRHPEMRGPVHWVGESYAGVRVQWILAYLRDRWDLAPYEDPAVRSRVAAIDRATSLFAGQILIQPWLAGGPHADAILAACDDPATLAAVSESLGAPCVEGNACACARNNGRSQYNYTFTDEHQRAREREASLAHVIPDRAEALLGVPLDSIPLLAAKERSKGFKCSAPDDETPSDGELVKAFGPLPAGQVYYVPYSPLLPGKEISPVKPDWRYAGFEGPAFADNLRDVPAFVTDGARDLVVPTRALAPALRVILGADRVDDGSKGRLGIAYPDGDRTITLGHYPSAGHMVTMIEPEPFARDVTAWRDEHTKAP